ncbi:hypothetical protein KIN20_013221 [Parelaphostrongylus tenuis]|uniref:Uncharacterized protein n=1 Tax=Parelaphostrongylus tenuis TaxID=148309 RepID=A0AAD5MXU3_PARTN|nr:hypothetical protein KIN20_013221 [Parelaphostrongylus tenuis]
MDMDNNSFNDMSQSQPKVNPPEPKSRSLSAHISTIVMSSNPTDDYSSTSNNEEFLASVFEGIKLPDVSYSQDPQRAIKQIDDVLASEADDDHYDDSALFVNEYNHSSTTAYHLAVNVNNSNTATNGIEKHMVPGEDYQHCEGYSESELLRLPDRFEESDGKMVFLMLSSFIVIVFCESIPTEKYGRLQFLISLNLTRIRVFSAV